MQVSVETTGSLTRKMTIAVPSAEFETRIAKRVRSAAKEVSLPGFRRGRVPLREVERRYGAAIRNEVASEVVRSSLEDAVRREEIALAGTPSVEIVNIDSGTDLAFTATFEVLPEIDLVDLSTLRVRRPAAEVSESDVDAMVESLRRQRAQWNAVERPAAIDDRVLVDYSCKVDGEVRGEPRTDFAFVVGSSRASSELDAAVAGMSVGETRSFPVTIQQDDNDNSGDVEAIGEVALKTVEEASLPALDLAFFESFGADAAASADAAAAADAPAYATEADATATALGKFRADVRGRMTSELEVAARKAMRRQVMAALAESHAFELPRTLVEEELERERERLARLGVPLGVADLGETMRQRVEERLRIRLVVREIVQRETLKPDEARTRARIEEIAAAYEQPDDVRNWIYGDEEQFQRVERDVLEDQLVEHVLSKANVVSVPASYEDVITGNAIPEPAVTGNAIPEPAGDEADIATPLEPDADREPESPKRQSKGWLRWLAGGRFSRRQRID